MPDSSRPEERFIKPDWPDEPFNLLAEDGGFEIGPFTKDGFDVMPDGALLWSDGYSHPVTLRIRRQRGNLIYANNGGVGPMTYRIVPLSFYENQNK